jgi:hypothetical protein
MLEMRVSSLCGAPEEEERFLSTQADTFAGANVKEKESACFIRNDGGRGGVK